MGRTRFFRWVRLGLLPAATFWVSSAQAQDRFAWTYGVGSSSIFAELPVGSDQTQSVSSPMALRVNLDAAWMLSSKLSLGLTMPMTVASVTARTADETRGASLLVLTPGASLGYVDAERRFYVTGSMGWLMALPDQGATGMGPSVSVGGGAAVPSNFKAVVFGIGGLFQWAPWVWSPSLGSGTAGNVWSLSLGPWIRL